MILNNKKRLSLIVALYITVIAFLVFTNPDNLPLPLLTLPFIILFAALFLTIDLLLSRFFSNLGTRARRGLALSLTGLPVLLLILQSIGQLSLRDLLITGGLIFGLIFYFRKTDFLK